MGQEFDLVLQRQRARRPSGGVFGTASAVAAAQVAAASGVDAEAAIKREPPSTPELDTIMDWLTSVNGAAAVPSPSTAAIKHLVGVWDAMVTGASRAVQGSALPASTQPGCTVAPPTISTGRLASCHQQPSARRADRLQGV